MGSSNLTKFLNSNPEKGKGWKPNSNWQKLHAAEAMPGLQHEILGLGLGVYGFMGLGF